MNEPHFYKSLDPKGKKDFAARVGTNSAYLSHVFNGHRKAGWALAWRIHDASGGEWNIAELRPEIKERMSGLHVETPDRVFT